jgi:hypothetical protein
MKREGQFAVEYQDSRGRWHRRRIGTFDNLDDAIAFIDCRTDYGRVKQLGKRAKYDVIVWRGRLATND